MSIETVLHAIKERGARATLAVLDASRRNPYERRFRTYLTVAPVTAPNNSLIISSNTPGKVADDTNGERSVLVTELCSTSSMRPLALKASSTRPVSPSFAPPMVRRRRPCLLTFRGRALQP